MRVAQAYWRRQLRRTGVLLAVWAFASLGCSILFVEQLNRISFGDMPFGFWMAQQGSIYVFILLIFLYALLSERADREAVLEPEGDDEGAAPEPPSDREA